MKLRQLLFVSASALVAACAVNPATGRRELSLVSEAQEIQMGRESDQQVSASLGIVDDPELQAYVARLGQGLAASSERPELPWSFKVVDDPVVNAFALPGGFIYVTRGILAHFDSEAELAGVLGHEIGHVTAKHSVSQISRQQLQQIGLGVGMILSEDVRRYGGLVGAGLQVLNLRYSRGDETQADELGLRYMSGIGYDPQSMIGVFRMLATVGGGAGGRVPEWQLTHPYPENREDHIRERIAAEGLQPGGQVGRDAFLDQIEGIVYGDDPRQGYFKETRFLHPDLAFELTFPVGWNTLNQRSVVAAVAPSEDAVMTLEVAVDATDPVAVLRAFLAQDGVRGGAIRQESQGGVQRARASFDATASDASVRGEAAFVRLGDTVYRLLAYADPARWSAYEAEVSRAVTSFRALTDLNVLAVRPWTVSVRRLPSAMSLRSYASGQTSPVPLEELAALNRVGVAEVLSGGVRIRWVVGDPLP